MWQQSLLFIVIFQEATSLNKKSIDNFASLDKILDQITINIQTKGKEIGLDSLPLPDIKQETNKKEVFSLTKGVLHNLTSIERYGQSMISYVERKLQVNLGFHFTGLKVNYDFDIHKWNMNPTGNLVGELSDLRFYAGVIIDTNMLNGTLNRFEIPTTGEIDFSVKATVPIYEYIVKDILLALAPFQDILVYEIAKELKNKINEILKNITALTIDQVLSEIMKS